MIAVNNRRVLTIAEFREQMSIAQEGTHVVLKVSCFAVAECVCQGCLMWLI